MASYCNITTDLQKEFSRIEDYQGAEILENWTSHSGDIYKKTGIGDIELIWVDGVKYTDNEAIPDGDAEFWFDADTQTLYLQIGSGLNPANYTVENKPEWEALKTAVRNEAMEVLDAYMNKKYSTPLLPRSSRNHTTDTFEIPIRKACAALTCAFLIQRIDPDDPNWMMLYKRAYNDSPEEGESKGIINQYLDGDLAREDDITPREVGNWNVFADSGNTGTYNPVLFGTYNSSGYREWLIEIDTGGAIGTATFKVSYDGGTTWDLTAQDTHDASEDEYRMYINAGIYAYWPNSTWTLADKWTVKLYPLSDTATDAGIGSIRVTR